MLVDPIGRKLEYLRVSVTDCCNMSCIYCCTGNNKRRNELSRESIVYAVTGGVAAGIRKVRLTGGEPLLRDDIIQLTADIAAIPGLDDLSLTTNGTKLSQLAAQLAFAGLHRVNISLDSLETNNFRRITRGGNLKQTLLGIDTAFSAGLLPVKINMVVMRGINDHEIDIFARLTMERDIHIRFIEYMPMRGQENLWQKHYLSSNEIMLRCETVASLVPLPHDKLSGPAQNFTFAGAKGKIGFITPISRHFCSHCNRLRLTNDGKLKPCLFSDVHIDLLPALNKKKDLLPFFIETTKLKPITINNTSPALQSSVCGPRAMAEIGG